MRVGFLLAQLLGAHKAPRLAQACSFPLAMLSPSNGFPRLPDCFTICWVLLVCLSLPGSLFY